MRIHTHTRTHIYRYLREISQVFVYRRSKIGNFKKTKGGTADTHLFLQFTKFKKIHFIIFNPLSRCLFRSCALFFAIQYPYTCIICVCACNEIIYTSLRALSHSPVPLRWCCTRLLPLFRVRDFGSFLCSRTDCIRFLYYFFFHLIPTVYAR